MAHDKQYKESSDLGLDIVEFGYPRPGDEYWSRVNHRVQVADKDMCVECAIIKRALP